MALAMVLWPSAAIPPDLTSGVFTQGLEGWEGGGRTGQPNFPWLPSVLFQPHDLGDSPSHLLQVGEGRRIAKKESSSSYCA